MASPVLKCLERKAGAISYMATTKQRAAKLDIADFLLDAAMTRNPIVEADDGANQLAECREDFSNKIP